MPSATTGLAPMGNYSGIPSSLRVCTQTTAYAIHPSGRHSLSTMRHSVQPVASPPPLMLSKPFSEYDTEYLWALLFAFVDIQLDLRRAGEMRNAVVVRQRCRAIGIELRDRYDTVDM